MAGVGRIPLWEWLPWRGWRIITVVDAADEIPPRLPAGGAVIVGTLARPKWLAFDCPCKTGHRIMVTLDPVHRPHWAIKNGKKLTVSPSIDYRTTDRRCHYFVRDGKIIWANDREERFYGKH